MNPVNAPQVVARDTGFSQEEEEMDDRVVGGSQLDWDLGAILELNVAFKRWDRIGTPPFDDADLKIV